MQVVTWLREGGRCVQSSVRYDVTHFELLSAQELKMVQRRGGLVYSTQPKKEIDAGG